ncbi:U1 small nuclear ribonucleoprotein 70 kDa isoform X4 [Panthera onca]
MTQFLPPNLLALFAPRDPIPYLPPLEKLPHEKHHNQPYCGIAPYIREFEDPRDAPPPTRAETREERMERKRREKIERRQQEVETELKMWDPHNDPNAQGDAFKTLFVARVNYDTTESKLRREFEVYGPIKRIHMVYSKRSGKPRGYAFIEYEHERDMHSAYKHADGKKIDGRRVLVDVERGRTVKGWRPRRLVEDTSLFRIIPVTFQMPGQLPVPVRTFALRASFACFHPALLKSFPFVELRPASLKLASGPCGAERCTRGQLLESAGIPVPFLHLRCQVPVWASDSLGLFCHPKKAPLLLSCPLTTVRRHLRYMLVTANPDLVLTFTVPNSLERQEFPAHRGVCTVKRHLKF